MHSNGVCTTVRYHTKLCESWQMNWVFRLSLGLSTQILEFEYKQAYKMIEAGVLVCKSKNMKQYQSTFVFFYFVSNMPKAKWWSHEFYSFSEFECQTMSRLYAGSWAKSWADRLYTLSYYIVEQIRLGSHLLLHWRTHTLGCCRKPYHISFRWLGHPNPKSLLLHYRSIPCLNILVGSVGYLITLLKYSLFHYIVEVYPKNLHC